MHVRGLIPRNLAELDEAVPIVCAGCPRWQTGLEVIKPEFILGLKIKRNDWLYFESENVLKFYNLEARSRVIVLRGFLFW